MISRDLIAFTGYAGSGKSECAGYLEDMYAFRGYSFADPIKTAVAAMFGWDPDDLEGDTDYSRMFRERVDPWWSEALGIEDFTPRKAMQIFGTDIMRRWNDDIWVSIMERRIDEARKYHYRVVIDDCRFPNEIDMVLRKGGIVVIVDRPDAERTNMHESETAWIAREPACCRIYNHGSIEGLHNHLDDMMNLWP